MDIERIRKGIIESKNHDIKKLLDNYRAKDKKGFVREIGDKGIYYDYDVLKNKIDEELSELTKEFIACIPNRGLFKSLFMKTSEKKAEDDKYQLANEKYSKEKKLREDEIIIGKAFFNKELSGVEKIKLEYMPFHRVIDDYHKSQLSMDKNYSFGLEKFKGPHLNTNKNLNFKSMSGLKFENYVCDLLRRLGYKNVTLTSRLGTGASYTGDGGIDITAIDNKNRKVAIQCKNKNIVSNDIISRTHGAKDLSQYKCDYAMVITSGEFTVPAQIEARDLNVVLWDGKKLEILEQKYNEGKIEYDY